MKQLFIFFKLVYLLNITELTIIKRIYISVDFVVIIFKDRHATKVSAWIIEFHVVFAVPYIFYAFITINIQSVKL